MTTRKELGKISNVKFGLGGYQDCMIGIHFTIQGKGWGICTDHCFWDSNKIEVSSSSQWSETDRNKAYSETVRFISDLLKKANVEKIDDLKGIPVEAEFEDLKLKSWRILEEVI